MIEIYTRTDCKFCEQAKKILAAVEVEYTEHVIGESVQREDLLERVPTAKILPVVLVDDKFIGGYTELLDYLYPA